MITYCTNVHPGESWNEVLSNLRTYFLEVKESVSPDKTFPMGLRLSNLASLEIDERVSAWFHDWCEQQNCYVATINGFPYGHFHSIPIKENVYLPDWRAAERVEYTKRLARLLDAWLPVNKTGSISTVPVGFKNCIASEDLDLIRQNLIQVLEYLDILKQKSGKEIILSLEPEPGCVLETTADVVRFFEQMEFPENLREGIGICFDCCHHAVEFEEPQKAFITLSNANIRLGKVQVSSALRMRSFDYHILKSFCEPSYLHQVVIREKDGTLKRYNDLPDAIDADHMNNEDEWRIHFHIPVFIDKTDSYGTTRSFTEEVITLIGKDILLEVETYTWNVLPAEMQTETVTRSIIREIQWVQGERNKYY